MISFPDDSPHYLYPKYVPLINSDHDPNPSPPPPLASYHAWKFRVSASFKPKDARASIACRQRRMDGVFIYSKIQQCGNLLYL